MTWRSLQIYLFDIIINIIWYITYIITDGLEPHDFGAAGAGAGLEYEGVGEYEGVEDEPPAAFPLHPPPAGATPDNLTVGEYDDDVDLPLGVEPPMRCDNPYPLPAAPADVHD